MTLEDLDILLTENLQEMERIAEEREWLTLARMELVKDVKKDLGVRSNFNEKNHRKKLTGRCLCVYDKGEMVQNPKCKEHLTLNK